MLPVGCGGRIPCAGASAVHGLLLLCFRHCGGSSAGLLPDVQGSACRLLELPLTHDGDALPFGCCSRLSTRTGQLGCWCSTTSSRGGATRDAAPSPAPCYASSLGCRGSFSSLLAGRLQHEKRGSNTGNKVQEAAVYSCCRQARQRRQQDRPPATQCGNDMQSHHLPTSSGESPVSARRLPRTATYRCGALVS